MKINEVVQQYIALRSQLDAKRKEYKDFEGQVKDQLLQMELQILDVSHETGVNSFATEYGTAYRTTKKYASVKDRKLLETYVETHHDMGLFTNHINKSHVIELMNEGLNPADIGVDYQEEQAINIRKAN